MISQRVSWFNDLGLKITKYCLIVAVFEGKKRPTSIDFWGMILICPSTNAWPKVIESGNYAKNQILWSLELENTFKMSTWRSIRRSLTINPRIIELFITIKEYYVTVC